MKKENQIKIRFQRIDLDSPEVHKVADICLRLSKGYHNKSHFVQQMSEENKKKKCIRVKLNHPARNRLRLIIMLQKKRVFYYETVHLSN